MTGIKEPSPEQSVNPGRTAEASLYHERQARKRQVKTAAKESESYHLVEGGKVIKKTVMPNGNTYSVYIGTRKECDAQGLKYSK